MSDEDRTSTALKVGSYLSMALGPILSKTLPMASDNRIWAFWFSLIVSAAMLLWLSVRLSDPATKSLAEKALGGSCAAAVIFAFVYIATNIFWTTEHGDITDDLWRLALIGSFGLSVGCITGALVAWEKRASSGVNSAARTD